MAAPGCSTDDDDSGRSSELNSLKNRDADATNPNIYNSIEKVDHVYDEIQQKDCKDIGRSIIYKTVVKESASKNFCFGVVVGRY